MPIYAYKCSACGHAQDVLQKISDDPLTACPACGAPAFSKQVTAAGFQLKGSGWYVTDFRSNGSGANSGVAKPDDAPKDPAPSTDATKPAPASPATPTQASPAAPSAAAASKSVASGTSFPCLCELMSR